MTERDRKDLRATSLAYGELRIEPFITALMKVRPCAFAAAGFAAAACGVHTHPIAGCSCEGCRFGTCTAD